LASIRPRLWQNDTAVAKNSWGYTENNDFKNPVDLVCDLVDIVSKNGVLLLNVGPRSDGTITEQDQKVLAGIGSWLKTNGEAIYGTSYWTQFGEGCTEVPEGAFSDVSRAKFTSEDIRFTFKAPYLYATVLSWPKNGKVLIKALKLDIDHKVQCYKGDIKSVEVLGHPNKVQYTRDASGLSASVSGTIDTPYPVCLKIKLD
jgi:alpha-L-fucosidase